MTRQHDLGVLFLAVVLLLFCVTYLTECGPASKQRETAAVATPLSSPSGESEQEAEHKPKSVREFAAEEEKEEQQKKQNISHALQTAAANPEFRATYGLPP